MCNANKYRKKNCLKHSIRLLLLLLIDLWSALYMHLTFIKRPTVKISIILIFCGRVTQAWLYDVTDFIEEKMGRRLCYWYLTNIIQYWSLLNWRMFVVVFSVPKYWNCAVISRCFVTRVFRNVITEHSFKPDETL